MNLKTLLLGSAAVLVAASAAKAADAIAVEPSGAAGSGHGTPHRFRLVRFDRGSEPVDTPVYRRETLGAGQRFDGPCIVEERETTAVIRPGWTVTVGEDGSLIADRRKS